ncbi:MAG: D-alanine--D-alanine ligase family protein [Chloroflexota bacterium]
MARKLRVGVIFGGRSGEHAVSLASAQSIMAALDKEKYEIVPIGITRDGRWLLTGNPLKALSEGIEVAGGTPVTLAGAGALIPVEPVKGNGAVSPLPAGNGDLPLGGALDVVFPVLHGTFGEDGSVQGLLELSDVAYVGSGVLGSALGMDKVAQKQLFRYHGLPTVDWVLTTGAELARARDRVMADIEARIGFPCFVKPANLGSSVGISKVRNPAELGAALDLAASYDRRVIIEASAGDVREIECSVLGNDDPIASLPGEILPANEFYDYKAKYIDDKSRLVIPAELPQETVQMIRRIAIEAFTVLDCAGLARVDFFVDRRTGRVLLNEINTIPGFTKISMYPKLWEASGISYSQLVDKLIELALERHEAKNRLRRDFQPQN